ncbi:hypothetical protein FRC17_002323 [Serendipita sp. 399]|nr:hypothetical protein FRC17_002323 [Serendipita sp. 399]
MPPLPQSRDEVSVDEIKRLVITAARVDAMLQQKTMPDPVKIWNLRIPNGTEILYGDADPDSVELKSSLLASSDERVQNVPQLWAWLMTDGIHLLSMSKSSIMRLWDMKRRIILTSIDVMGPLACWDYTMDAAGVTLIVNSEDPTTSSEMFRAWRYNWGDEAPTLILRRHLFADIRSNFIQDKLTGCVMLSEDGRAIVYLANWVTGKEVEFGTNLQLPYALSSCTSSKELSLYAENADHGLHHTYSLEDLSRFLETDLANSKAPKPSTSLIDFDHSLMMGDDLWIPTTRPISDDLIAVLSRAAVPGDGPLPAQTVTLSVFRTWSLWDADLGALVTTQTTSRSVVHNIDPPGILPCPEGWELSSMGMFAKTSVWMENSRALGSDGTPLFRTLCLAAFPKEVASIPSTSTLESILPEVGDGSQNGEDLEQDDSEGNHSSSDSHADEPAPSTLENEVISPESPGSNSPVGQSSPNPTPLDELVTAAPMENVTDESSQNVWSTPTVPRTVGHVCEYNFPYDWTDKNGGIYTVDFDDARGRVAFATGSEGVLILEFLS